MEDQLTVLLPAGHPLARRRAVKLADLSEERWIAGCPRCRANFLHECAEQGFVPDIAFTTDDNLVVQSMVAAGLGVAMMPGLVLSFLVHRKVTGRALDPASRRHVSAYVLREHLRVPADRAGAGRTQGGGGEPGRLLTGPASRGVSRSGSWSRRPVPGAVTPLPVRAAELPPGRPGSTSHP